MSEKKKGKEKFPALSKEEIEREAKAQEKASVQYSMEQAEVEKALTEYMEMLDPILWTNPRTNVEKAIAWVRRPTMKQLKALIPPDVAKYVDKGEEIPEELNKKYEKYFYEKMSELIAIPERTPAEWEEKINPWFLRLFLEHVNNIAKFVQGQIEGF